MKTYEWNDRLPDAGPLTPPEPSFECNQCAHLFNLNRHDEPECPQCESDDIHRT